MRPLLTFFLLPISISVIHSAEPPIPQPPLAEKLYYLQPDGKRLLPLEQQTPVLRASRSFAAADMEGLASPFRVLSTQPTFVIRRSAPPDKTFDRLMWLESVNGKRTLLLSVGADKIGIPMPGKDFEMEFRPAGLNTYALRPVRPLAPGEYGLNFGKSNVTFLFGVDAGATTPDDSPSEASAPASTAADPANDKRRILDSLLQKKLITEADYRSKLAELAAPPAAPGPEGRLRRLDELLKKGLISKPDYQKKRAEILAEI